MSECILCGNDITPETRLSCTDLVCNHCGKDVDYDDEYEISREYREEVMRQMDDLYRWTFGD